MLRKAVLLFFVILLVLSTCFYHTLPVMAQSYTEENSIIPRQIIVKFKTGISKQKISSLETSLSAQLADTPTDTGFILLQLPPGSDLNQAIKKLQSNPQVELAEPNHVVKASFIPNDPYYVYQWGLEKIKANYSWDNVVGDSNIKIAVLDTGINAEHPDLAGTILEGQNTVDLNNPGDTADRDGHGTHVAGIIGATMNNNIGVAGIAAGVSILPVKVLDDSGYGTNWSVAKGIDFAVSAGARVINMSLGSLYGSSIEGDAVKRAIQQEVIVVAAAGNNGSTNVNYPAKYPGVLAVSATDSQDRLAYFSNYGSSISFAAPGVDILSCFAGTYADPSDPYAMLSGTSMATPFVSGLAGILLSERPNLTAEQVIMIMQLSADDLGLEGRDAKFGYGRINSNKAIDFGAIRFTLPETTPIAGKPITIEVSVEDFFGNIKGGVNSRVHLEISNQNVIVSNSEINIINGRGTVDVTFTSAGVYNLAARDEGIPEKWIRGTIQINVQEGPFPAKLLLELPQKATVGAAVYGVVYAADQFNQVISDFQGAVSINCNVTDGVILPQEPVRIGEIFNLTFLRPGVFHIGVDELNHMLESTSLEVEVTGSQSITGCVFLEGRKMHGGIKVLLSGTDQEIITNPEGFFLFDGLVTGSYEIIISSKQFLKKRVGPVNVQPGEKVVLSEIWLTAGDINNNNEVELFDFVTLARAYGTEHGEERWHQDADINLDFRINLYDFCWLAKNYGRAGDV